MQHYLKLNLELEAVMYPGLSSLGDGRSYDGGIGGEGLHLN